MITQSEALNYFTYDNGVLMWNVNLPFHKTKGTVAGGVSKNGYTRLSINKKQYYIHRIIFLMFNGYMPEQIDHMNGIRNDNRIENLRESSNMQNAWNRKIKNTNNTGVKGVYWNKLKNRYYAVVGHNYKSVQAGVFTTLQEAKTAVENKRKEIHKEFSNHG